MAQDTISSPVLLAQRGNTTSRHIPGLQAIDGVENRWGL